MTAKLLIDQVLPRSDLAVAHARVFPVQPEVCYQTARRLDFFQVPLIRTLIGLRGLPQRLAGVLTGHHTPAAPARRRLRLADDLAGLGFSRLGETPGVELLWGQVSRPWKPLAGSIGPPRTAEAFAGFDQPGFAKIAFSLRVDPHGEGASVLTLETRVALTDEQSRRRFRRYWRLIGPFSALIRRLALRQVAAELSRFREPVAPTGRDSRGSAKTGPRRSGVPRGLGERIRTRLEHEVDTRSARLGVGLLRLTKGRIARLWRRQVLVLTTRGRRSGRERTVPLQYFPDGENLIVVAANSGLPSPPGWYFNLTADPRARVEVGGRRLAVRAEELSAEEAAAFWPRVLRAAPDYARYPRRTSRRIPLLRLVPATPATASDITSGSVGQPPARRGTDPSNGER
ncbi:MAG TPA: nitroreductase/quinone reductase family protein [Actinomycetota bacterium]|nr:nitroreductase/quinone reductase family protein [Actinomycetota bacterium]